MTVAREREEEKLCWGKKVGRIVLYTSQVGVSTVRMTGEGFEGAPGQERKDVLTAE